MDGNARLGQELVQIGRRCVHALSRLLGAGKGCAGAGLVRQGRSVKDAFVVRGCMPAWFERVFFGNRSSAGVCDQSKEYNPLFACFQGFKVFPV